MTTQEPVVASPRNSKQSNWRIRRRFMFVVAAFCMLTVGYVLLKDLSSGPADTAVTMSFVTLISILGSYVFGAAWEDINMAKIKGSKTTTGDQS